MTRLIGFRWKCSNAWSREVLMIHIPIRKCVYHTKRKNVDSVTNLQACFLRDTYLYLRHSFAKNGKIFNILFWWFSTVVTPLPIPNRVVKRWYTDGTGFPGRVGVAGTKYWISLTPLEIRVFLFFTMYWLLYINMI